MNEAEKKGAKKVILGMAKRVKQAIKDHERAEKVAAKVRLHCLAQEHASMVSSLRGDGPYMLADVYEAATGGGNNDGGVRDEIRKIIRGE